MEISNNLIIDSKVLPREIEHFLANTGRKHWENTINLIETRSGNFYKQFQYIRNPIANALKLYFEMSRKGKSIRHSFRLQEINLLGSTAVIFNLIWKSLGDVDRRKLVNRFAADDVRSVLFEFKLMAHYLRQQFEVQLPEYDNLYANRKVFDMLIRKDSKEFELECKYKEYDSKRKVTRPAIYLLADNICNNIDIHGYNCIVLLNFTKSLSTNAAEQRKIVEVLKSKLVHKDWSLEEYDGYSLELLPLPFHKVLDTYEKLQDFVKPFNSTSGHFISLSSKNSNFILKCESLKKEEVVEGIYTSLKEATSQFTKSRPGIIACHIEDINPDELQQLKEGALREMTNYFFSKENRSFIQSVAYSSNAYLMTDSNIGESVTRYLIFKNPKAEYYQEYGTDYLVDNN